MTLLGNRVLVGVNTWSYHLSLGSLRLSAIEVLGDVIVVHVVELCYAEDLHNTVTVLAIFGHRI